MRAILDLRPDAIFVFSESTEYVHPGSPDMVQQAHFMNERRFLSLDLLFGHDVTRHHVSLPPRQRHDRGGIRLVTWADRDLRSHCIMGTDYYITNEHVIQRDGNEHRRRRRVRLLRHHPAVFRPLPHAGHAHRNQPRRASTPSSGCGRSG